MRAGHKAKKAGSDVAFDGARRIDKENRRVHQEKQKKQREKTLDVLRDLVSKNKGLEFKLRKEKEGKGSTTWEVVVEFKPGFDKECLTETDHLVLAAILDPAFTIDVSWTEDPLTQAGGGKTDVTGKSVTLSSSYSYQDKEHSRKDPDRPAPESVEMTFAHEVFGHALMTQYGYKSQQSSVVIENKFRNAKELGERSGRDHEQAKREPGKPLLRDFTGLAHEFLPVKRSPGATIGE